MCYSAQIEADYRRYVRDFGAELDIKEFYELFWRRLGEPKIKIPKAMAAAFAETVTDAELKIREAIDSFAASETVKLEQMMFEQRKRLADAERTLQTKPTKAAANNQRIATDKIASAMGKLADLKRLELVEVDSRIFPGHYAPVMVMENGKRVVRPMRYQCRPAGKPAFYDTKFPGTYNARRDNLEGFWKGQFGVSHAVLVANTFYENVNRHRAERRDLKEGEGVENVVLEFRPESHRDMLVACLWSRWSGPGEPDLLSFAAITDDPPAEISEVGHDRCIIPIKPENIDVWLDPDPKNLAASYAILDDREQPYYEHRWLQAA